MIMCDCQRELTREEIEELEKKKELGYPLNDREKRFEKEMKIGILKCILGAFLFLGLLSLVEFIFRIII